MKLRRRLPSPIVSVNGHNTSVGLEDGFCNALKEIAAAQKITIQEIVLKIDRARESRNLSSAASMFS
jgi:predicted DNA-binding ribbon-helix-helix protein